MRSVKPLFAGSLLVVFAAGACGGSGHDNGAPDNEDLSQLTSEDLCQRKCELQVAPNCPDVPANYVSACMLLCQAKYEKFPGCTEVSRAIDTCGIQRVHYGCESGSLRPMPTGACAAEAGACQSCTGGVFACL